MKLGRALVALLAVACNSSKPAPVDAGTPPKPSASATGSAPEPTTSAPPLNPPLQRGCRALAAQGDVKLIPADTKVIVGTAVDGKSWLRLATGASVSLRHADSAREVAVKGPGLARPCLDGGEDVLLADGTVETATGPGARPGAEVVVATPFGSVSYGDAKLAIKVTQKRLEATASQGEAWIAPAKGATLKGNEKIVAPKGKAAVSGDPAPGPLVEACEAAAGEAERLAKSVLAGPGADAGPDAGTLGDRAAAHVRARRSARSVCRIALAAVARLADAAKREELEQRLGRAEKQWSGIPKP